MGGLLWMALGQAAEDLDDLDRSVAIASWDFRHDGVRRDADLSKRREYGRRIMMVSLLLTFIGGILVWRDLMMSYETYTFSTAVEVFYIVLNVVLSLMMFGEYMFLYIDKKLSKE